MDLVAHLEAYAAVADEVSFSRAADRLGIAQPLLSRRIKTLEEHFGETLFDRSRRQITITEFGVLLLPHAHDVLDRVRQLRHVARSARESAIRAIGVPADCDPAALARVIRAGAERGTTLGLHELPPDARVAGIADGSLSYALVRVSPERAALRVPLGLASAPPSGATDTGAADERHRTRPVHLDELRTRRGRGGTRHTPMPILTTIEDRLPYAEDRLARVAARAGLPAGLIRPAGSVATPLAEMLAGRATLLCAEPFARRHGAAWALLADTTLHRGYDVSVRPRGRRGVADDAGWLVALLAAAVGATAAPGPSDTTDVPVPSRLAALG